MKKNIVIIILLIAVMVLSYVRVKEVNYFSFSATVTEVQENGFLCITKAGEEWHCDAKGFDKGDKVRLVVNSHNSDNWEDMELIRVEKY